MQRYREKQTIQNFTAIFCCFALKVCVKGKLLPFTFPLRAGDRWFRATGLSPL